MYRRYAYQMLSLLLIVSNIVHGASLEEIKRKGCQSCSVLSLDWILKDNNYYIAYAGADETNNKEIKVALFNPLNPEPTMLINKASANFGTTDDRINSIDEITINGATFIAAGGFTDDNNDQIVIYEFVDHKLKKRAEKTVDSTVNTVKWLSVTDDNQDTFYYLAVGTNERGNWELAVYGFDPEEHDLDLLPDTRQNFFNGAVNSVDWLSYNGNYYLAVGGFETASIPNEIRIYQFSSNDEALMLLSAVSYFANTVNALKWYQNEDSLYLATVGNDSVDSSQIRIFSFDPMSPTLALLDDSSFNSNAIAYAVDWLDFEGTTYLVVGGNASTSGNGIELFTFIADTLSSVAVVTEATADVRTLMWNVIDETAYLAAGTTLRTPLRVFELVIGQ